MSVIPGLRPPPRDLTSKQGRKWFEWVATATRPKIVRDYINSTGTNSSNVAGATIKSVEFPGSCLLTQDDSISVIAQGSFAANANSKSIAVTVASAGIAVAGSGSAPSGHWRAELRVFRDGRYVGFSWYTDSGGVQQNKWEGTSSPDDWRSPFLVKVIDVFGTAANDITVTGLLAETIYSGMPL